MALFGFPNPVDEVSARLVAGGVVAMCLVALVTGHSWVLLVIAYGFAARVLTGPRLSPLGLLVTRVIRPRLAVAPRLVPGPPKRFAQGLGWLFSTVAVALAFGFDSPGGSDLFIGLLMMAAALEAFLGLCLGCRLFALLMRAGIIPRTVCEACDNLWERRAGLGSPGADVPP